jgi:metal-dependent amidase/aminoacylase/carboxypeptidase family protein
VQLIYGGKLLGDAVVLSTLRVLEDSSVLHCVRRSVLKRAAAEAAEMQRSSSASDQSTAAPAPADEQSFHEALLGRRLRVKDVIGDGNCMFRSIADQIYSDEEMHAVTREMCMDYMEQNREHFEEFIAGEDFSDYLQRKRQDRCYGCAVTPGAAY